MRRHPTDRSTATVGHRDPRWTSAISGMTARQAADPCGPRLTSIDRLPSWFAWGSSWLCSGRDCVGALVRHVVGAIVDAGGSHEMHDGVFGASLHDPVQIHRGVTAVYPVGVRPERGRGRARYRPEIVGHQLAGAGVARIQLEVALPPAAAGPTAKQHAVPVALVA